MARRYDLGTVVGKIIFNYDDTGTKRSQDDLDNSKRKAEEFGKSFDKVTDKMGKKALAIALTFGKIALAMSALSSGIGIIQGIGAALVAMSGAALLIPGVMAAGAAAMVTWKLGADGVKKAMAGLKPTIDALKKSVSATFEKGLAPAINNLKVIVPQLTKQFQAIAREISNVAVQVTNMLKTKASMIDLGAILNSTKLIIQNLGKAVAPVIQAFLDIASVGANSFVTMTEGAGTAAQSFAAFIREAKESGKIKDWIQTGVDAFKTFWDILVQIVAIFAAIFKGLAGTGTAAGPLVEVLRTINSFLSGLQGQAALGALGDALREVGKAVSTVLLAALKAIAPLVPPLAKSFAVLATDVVPLLVSAIEFLAPVLLNIANYIQDNIHWISPLVIALGIWTAAQWALNAAMALNPVGLTILAIAALVAIVAVIITYWGPISGFFVDLWNTIWKWTSDRITDIWNFIQSVFGAIVDFFVGIGHDIEDAWNTTMSALGDAVNAVGDFFVSIGSAIADAAKAVGDWFAKIPGYVADGLAALPGLMLDALKWTLNAAIQGIEWIIAAFIAIPIDIGIALAQFGIWFVNWIVDAFTQVNQWIAQGIITMVAWFQALPSRILLAVSEFAVSFVNWITTSWQQMQDAALLMGAEFITWIQTLPSRILEAVATFAVSFINWATTAWQQMKDAAILKGAEFLLWVSAIPGNVIDAVAGFAAMIITWARNSFQSMKDAAAQRGVEFINWARGIPGWVLGALGDAGSWLLEAGRNVVQGLWNGIQAMAGWLWNKVTSFVGGIVDKVKSLLLIGSPSKVFADEVGHWIPAGIGQGIADNASAAHNALATLAEGMGTAINATNIGLPLGMQIADGVNTGIQTGLKTVDLQSIMPDAVTAGLAPWVASLTSSAPAPTAMPVGSGGAVTIGTVQLNVTGNLDPTNPIQWRKAMTSIEDGIRQVGRQNA